MLVHTSHKVDKIDYVAEKINDFLEKLNDKLKTDIILIQKFREALEVILAETQKIRYLRNTLI